MSCADAQALPTPNWGTGEAEEYAAPPSATEAQVQAIWQDVLGRERVSTQADFFAAGGNSLQARPTALTQSFLLLCIRPLPSAPQPLRKAFSCSACALYQG